MGLFNKLVSKESEIAFTTKNFFIGAPEAEAESNFNSRINLLNVFEDFLEVIPKLDYEKFIITGRKGSGKSAIAEYIHIKSEDEPNIFCEFIRKSDIDIEMIVQLSKENDAAISKELLIEWIILVNLVKQLISNEAIQHRKEIETLNAFLKKNSGFVDIKSNQIKEVIHSKGYEIKVNYFQRFLSGNFGNKFDIKGERAPFYKLIPHLKETVKYLFGVPENQDNAYILIFDDLDIGFKSTDENNIQTLLNLIRIVKDYNNNFFGKNNFHSKIIILLRDDISKVLRNYDADTAKIFSSYEIPLIWYEREVLRINENKSKLKQFINKRITLNLKELSIQYNSSDSWSSFVVSDPDYKKSSFQYVLDHTFYRPRDLILFFKSLPESNYAIPLTKKDINSLISKYAREVGNELRNELSAHYNAAEINIIFNALDKLSEQDNFTYKSFCDNLKGRGFKSNIDTLLELLFDFSVIGNFDLETGKPKFKFWESQEEFIVFNKLEALIIHRAIEIYLRQM